MKIPKIEKDFEELIKGIKWNRYLPVIIGIMQPVLIFGGWLAFAKFNKKADALSKLIAIAEPIPAIDLNLPRPVVLASLYHATDEALSILNDVIEFLKDVEIPSAGDIVKDIKETLVEDVITPIVGGGIEDERQFLTDYSDCLQNAKATLGIFYNKYTAFPWISGCLVKKGYGKDLVEEAIRRKLGI